MKKIKYLSLCLFLLFLLFCPIFYQNSNFEIINDDLFVECDVGQIFDLKQNITYKNKKNILVFQKSPFLNDKRIVNYQEKYICLEEFSEIYYIDYGFIYINSEKSQDFQDCIVVRICDNKLKPIQNLELYYYKENNRALTNKDGYVAIPISDTSEQCYVGIVNGSLLFSIDFCNKSIQAVNNKNVVAGNVLIIN